VRPLPSGEEAPRIASAGGAPQHEGPGVFGSLQNLLRSIIGGGQPAAATTH